MGDVARARDHTHHFGRVELNTNPGNDCPSMPRHLIVRHKTEYLYAEPVAFGRHRMMFRPRDSHSLRLLSTRLAIEPKPVQIRWAFDVFGNSVAFAEFGETRSTSLVFESEISLLHYEIQNPTSLLEGDAADFPFLYPDRDLPDLAPVMSLQHPDPKGLLAGWARQFADAAAGDTLRVLKGMMHAIRTGFTYQVRNAPGTQTPVETLNSETGTCRDYAVLMMEGLRSLGFAARFVSGYIYNPHRDNHRGGGATHAWVQVYLPGCGWVEIDPTNGIFGNRDLITIAVARDHRMASPLSGNFVGSASAYLSMKVDVAVTKGDAIRHHAVTK